MTTRVEQKYSSECGSRCFCLRRPSFDTPLAQKGTRRLAQSRRSPGTAARNLEHIAESLPDRMVEADALHLFRTALLSLQASLVVTDQNVARDGFKLGFGDWSYTTAGVSCQDAFVLPCSRKLNGDVPRFMVVCISLLV